MLIFNFDRILRRIKISKLHLELLRQEPVVVHQCMIPLYADEDDDSQEYEAGQGNKAPRALDKRKRHLGEAGHVSGGQFLAPL